MKDLYIIKIGGSVVFENNKLSQENLLNIIDDLLFFRKHSKIKIILIYGNGSYVYNILNRKKLFGKNISDRKKIEIGKLKFKLEDYNNKILKIFTKNNFQVFPISIFSTVEMISGKLNKIKLGIINNCLKNNIVPILRGDVVLDKTFAFSFITGDDILYYLSSVFRPDKVFILTSEEGVYTKDPKLNPNAELINKISFKTLGNYFNINDLLNEYENNPLRSEKMIYKVYKLSELIDKGYIINYARIFNGKIKGNLKNVLLNNAEVGTKIVKN